MSLSLIGWRIMIRGHPPCNNRSTAQSTLLTAHEYCTRVLHHLLTTNYAYDFIILHQVNIMDSC